MIESTETAEDVERLLGEARAKLAAFEKAVDGERLLARVKRSSPNHPILLLRGFFLLIAIASVVLMFLVIAAGTLHKPSAIILNGLDSKMGVPGGLPALCILLASSMFIGHTALTFVAHGAGRKSPMLSWEAKQHQKLVNEVTRLTTQKAVMERIRGTPGGARPRIATPVPMSMRSASPGRFGGAGAGFGSRQPSVPPYAQQQQGGFGSRQPSAPPYAQQPGGFGDRQQSASFQQPQAGGFGSRQPSLPPYAQPNPTPFGQHSTPPSKPSFAGGFDHAHASDRREHAGSAPDSTFSREPSSGQSSLLDRARSAAPAQAFPEAASPALVDGPSFGGSGFGTSQAPQNDSTSTGFGKQPSFGDPSRSFGDQPAGFGGPQPSGFGGTQPSGFGGTQPAGFGDQPAGFGGTQPSGFGGPQTGGFGSPEPAGFGSQPSFGSQTPGFGEPLGASRGQPTADSGPTGLQGPALSASSAFGSGGPSFSPPSTGFADAPFGAQVQTRGGTPLGAKPRAGIALGKPRSAPAATPPQPSYEEPSYDDDSYEDDEYEDLDESDYYEEPTAPPRIGIKMGVRKAVAAPVDELDFSDIVETTAPRVVLSDAATEARPRGLPVWGKIGEMWLEEAVEKAEKMVMGLPEQINLAFSVEEDLPFTLVIERATPAMAVRAMVGFIEFLDSIYTPKFARIKLIKVAHLDRSFHRNVDAALQPYFAGKVRVENNPGCVDIIFSDPDPAWDLYPVLPIR